MNYRILIESAAQKMLKCIRDRRVLQKIAADIDGLATEPEKQGKALLGELAGYRSLRSVGQRYRIIYKVERRQVIVAIVAVGLRRGGSRHDIYELARKLIHLRLVP